MGAPKAGWEWRLEGSLEHVRLDLHVIAGAGLRDSPTGGAYHCMPNSIGWKGRPWHLDPQRGYEEGTPMVLRRNLCNCMLDQRKGNEKDYRRTDWHCFLGTWTSHEVYHRKQGRTCKSS